MFSNTKPLEVWPITFKRLHEMYKSYKDAAEHPRRQTVLYEKYSEMQTLIRPLFEKDWVASFPVGTERIPGFDDGDMGRLRGMLDESHEWTRLTWDIIREEAIRLLHDRGYDVPGFPKPPRKPFGEEDA